MSTEATSAAIERVAFWRNFQKTSLQQFNRSGGNPARDVIFIVDPRDDFGSHFVEVCYKAALKEPGASTTPQEDMEILSLIGAPFVIILPLDAAKAALETRLPQALTALSAIPTMGKVRVAVIQDTDDDGPGCTVLTDNLAPTRAN